MGIWERLGRVVKSYLRDDSQEIHWRSSGKGHGQRRPGSTTSGDPDLDSAFEELEEFLRGEKTAESDFAGGTARQRQKPFGPVPDEIRKDFAELGLGPEASPEECKAAYKKFLKIHHPDRHAVNPQNAKKATEKTARINAAYKRLEEWFRALS